MSSKKGQRRSSVAGSVPSPTTSTSSTTPSPSMFSSEEDLVNTVAPSPKGRGTRKESEQRRRVMMNQYFDELITLLSMVSERNIPRKMDKATTLKEAVNCIQTYYDLGKHSSSKQDLESGGKAGGKSRSKSPAESSCKFPLGYKPGFLTEGEILSFFLDANDTFLIVVSESGRILYSTELITSLLGHMQTRLVGQNIYDYVHENDRDMIREIFQPPESEGSLCRMQLPNSPITAFPSQNFQSHFKLYSGETNCFPQYLPFDCRSYLRLWNEGLEGGSSSRPVSPVDSDVTSLGGTDERQGCILLLGKLPTSLTIIDLPIGTNDVNFEFEMRVSKEGRIIDIDKHASLIFGFASSELIGSSFFDYIDPYHIQEVGEAMSRFLNGGLGITTPFRIRSKGGRYLWVISKGYLSYNPWNNKPDHVLLSNRILGCDQVLPEHRFFRSRNLLPDTEGGESYEPPLNPVSTCSVPSPTNSTATTNASVDVNRDLHSAPTPPISIAPGTPQPTMQPDPKVVSQVQQMPHHSLLQQQQQTQQQEQQQTQQMQQQPVQPSMQQKPHVFQQPHMPVQHQPQSSSVCSMTSTATASLSQAGDPQDVDKELELKSRDLFELQRKLLEQQKQMERERNQFYQVTQQVMQFLSNSTGASMLPANLQLAMTSFPQQGTQMFPVSDAGSGGYGGRQAPLAMQQQQPPELVKIPPPPLLPLSQGHMQLSMPQPSPHRTTLTLTTPNSHNMGVDQLLSLLGGGGGGGGGGRLGLGDSGAAGRIGLGDSGAGRLGLGDSAAGRLGLGDSAAGRLGLGDSAAGRLGLGDSGGAARLGLGGLGAGGGRLGLGSGTLGLGGGEFSMLQPSTQMPQSIHSSHHQQQASLNAMLTQATTANYHIPPSPSATSTFGYPFTPSCQSMSTASSSLNSTSTYPASRSHTPAHGPYSPAHGPYSTNNQLTASSLNLNIGSPAMSHSPIGMTQAQLSNMYGSMSRLPTLPRLPMMPISTTSSVTGSGLAGMNADLLLPGDDLSVSR